MQCLILSISIWKRLVHNLDYADCRGWKKDWENKLIDLGIQSQYYPKYNLLQLKISNIEELEKHRCTIDELTAFAISKA